jgi:hypothetical protein
MSIPIPESIGRMQMEPGYLNSFETVIRCLRKDSAELWECGLIAKATCYRHAAVELEAWFETMKLHAELKAIEGGLA